MACVGIYLLMLQSFMNSGLQLCVPCSDDWWYMPGINLKLLVHPAGTCSGRPGPPVAVSGVHEFYRSRNWVISRRWRSFQ